MIAKFPLSDSTISSLAILNPKRRTSVSSADFTRLCQKLLGNPTPGEVDALLAELQEFKVLSDSQLPGMDESNPAHLEHV